MRGTRCDKCGQWADGEPAAIVALTLDGCSNITYIELCEDCSPAVVQLIADIARTESKPDAPEIIMSMGESRVGTEHDGSEGWLSESDA